MWAASADLRAALAASHEVHPEVFVVRGTGRTAVEIRGCTVQATLGTRGGRSADLSIDSGYLTESGLFDPLQDQVVIRAAVPGVGDLPLFTGRVDSVTDEDDGSVAVALISRGDELLRQPFEAPWAARVEAFASAEMRRLISALGPDWPVSINVVTDSYVPDGSVWEEEPGQALDDMAAAINALWIPDRVGGFTINTNPYSLTTAPLPALTVRDGEDGVIVNIRHVRSREQVRNSVTLIVERTDGLAPIRITARDTNPLSPTRWDGPFGRATEVFKLQTPLTEVEARLVAERRLSQSLALARAWTIALPSGLGNTLDPGDLLAVWWQGEVTGQLVESIRYSTTAESTVVVDTAEFRTVTPTPD